MILTPDNPEHQPQGPLRPCAPESTTAALSASAPHAAGAMLPTSASPTAPAACAGNRQRRAKRQRRARGEVQRARQAAARPPQAAAARAAPLSGVYLRRAVAWPGAVRDSGEAHNAVLTPSRGLCMQTLYILNDPTSASRPRIRSSAVARLMSAR